MAARALSKGSEGPRHNSRERQPDNAVAPPPADGPVPTTTPRYEVQVVAAASRQQGRALVERLAAAGHPAYVATAIVKNVEVFRVRVGPFDTLSEAKEVSRQLRRNGYDGAWIVR